MVEGDLRSHLYVLLVGEIRDGLAKGLSDLAGEYEAFLVRCVDVYMATAQCAKLTGARFLAVGSLRELARENGRFFTVAARNGGMCCALVDRDGSFGRDEVLTTVRMGAAVAADMNQLTGAFEHWLGIGRSVTDRPILMAEEYQASEAELNALLGQEVDG